MSRLGSKTLAVLHHLANQGDKNLFELERDLGMAQLGDPINKLRTGLYISSLPKKRGELQRYRITKFGAEAIGAHLQRQESMRYRPLHELPVYTPKETSVRIGSMDAYRLPSRGMT